MFGGTGSIRLEVHGNSERGEKGFAHGKRVTLGGKREDSVNNLLVNNLLG